MASLPDKHECFGAHEVGRQVATGGQHRTGAGRQVRTTGAQVLTGAHVLTGAQTRTTGAQTRMVGAQTDTGVGAQTGAHWLITGAQGLAQTGAHELAHTGAQELAQTGALEQAGAQDGTVVQGELQVDWALQPFEPHLPNNKPASADEPRKADAITVMNTKTIRMKSTSRRVEIG